MSSNDNDAAVPGGGAALADGHGLAALLLVESLIHGLCERATLSPQQAVEIVERAADVQSDQAGEADGAAGPMWHSHALLSAIATSLRVDANGNLPPPHLVP